MNKPLTATPQHAPWQLSLATILTFVFAVAIWLLLATRIPNELPFLTLFVMFSGIAATLFLWRKQKGLVVLLILFETIVVGTTVAQTLTRAASSRDYHAKKRLLKSIAEGMSIYASRCNGIPPPPADPAQHGKILHDLFTSDFLVSNNYIPKSPSGKLLGATGNRLKWEVHGGGDRFLLIDMGEDGIAGKYVHYETGDLKSIPVDANRDGIDDGADDAAVGGTWEKLK